MLCSKSLSIEIKESDHLTLLLSSVRFLSLSKLFERILRPICAAHELNAFQF